MSPSGFFRGSSKKELAVPIRSTGCFSCGLANAGLLHPKMEPTGEGKKEILFIAEGPGKDEDRLGVQLIGKVGQRLRRTLRDFDVDLDQDCWKDNSVRCRPISEKGENRAPTNDEIASCRHNVFGSIRESRPRVIILLGSSAVYSVLQGRWKHDPDFSIGRWRGLTIPDHDLGAWVCPTFHPSYIGRSDNYAPAADVIWRRDLARSISMADRPLPKRLEPEVRALEGSAVGDYMLDLWRRSKKEQVTLAIDYEADGLKPYRKDFKIYSCAIAENPWLAYAWSWTDDPKVLALYRSVMENPNIKKIAANLKYEHVLTRVKLGFEIQGWTWDTVSVAHILDNRAGNANVKFQAFTRLGILDYDSHIRPLLRTSDPNGINQIHKIPIKDLLKYNGEDSAYEFAIALDQQRELDK